MEEGHFTEQNVIREIELIKKHSIEKKWKSPTGELFHLNLPHTVYPPREDTNLLADALIKLGPGKGRKCLEIGIGSGVLSLLCHRQGWKVSGCDINPLAIASSIELFSRNSAQEIRVNEGGPGPIKDGSINQWTNGESYDLIFWNLPYINMENITEGVLGPLEDAALIDTSSSSLLCLTLEKIDRFDILNKNGIALFLTGNKYNDDNLEKIAVKHGFACRIVGKRTFDDSETIKILALWRPYQNTTKEHVKNITSTNTELLKTNWKVGSSLSADRQTKGRGRRGRKWINAEEAFACSWKIGDQSHINPIILQMICGNLVKKSLDDINEDKESSLLVLKWPNDILSVNDGIAGKISGILLESRSTGRQTDMVLGVGININQSTNRNIDFTMSSTSSLTEIVDKKQLQRSIECRISGLFETIKELPNTNFKLTLEACIEELNFGFSTPNDLIYRNKKVKFDNINQEGLVTLIDENGRTYLCDDGESITWKFN